MFLDLIRRAFLPDHVESSHVELPGDIVRAVDQEFSIIDRRERGTVIYHRATGINTYLTTVRHLAEQLREPFELTQAQALAMARLIRDKANRQAREGRRASWIHGYLEG